MTICEVDIVCFVFTAFTKSHNKHHRGKRRTSSKKTKNDKRGKLGNSLIFDICSQTNGFCFKVADIVPM